MSKGLNKVMLIGNVGGDVELRYTPGGKSVTSFRLATTRAWITSWGERHEQTEWFTVVAWDKLAEICSRFLRKGRCVYIEGRSCNRAWRDSDGQPEVSN